MNPDRTGDPEADSFWSAAAEGRLTYGFCPLCAAAIFPSRGLCPSCGGVTEVRTSRGGGEIYTWSRVHRSADTGFRDILPYAVAIVELDEGFRMVANVEPVEDVRIGARCTVMFRPSPATGRPAPLFRLQDVR